MDLDFALRIFIAGLLGGAIGLEREYRAKEAGFRPTFGVVRQCLVHDFVALGL